MSKGPSGTTTTVEQSNNPTQVAQLPFLTGQAGTNAGLGANYGWDQAVNLAAADPFSYYPGQTLATPDQGLSGGYQALTNYGQLGDSATALGAASGQGTAVNAENGFLGGVNAANNPAASGLSTAAGAVNPGLSSLENIASGGMLNSNPYLSGEYSAAAQPLVNAYQTATAPQTDSNFEAAGRYGSGAQANAQSTNQQNLGTALTNLSSNLYGQNYSNEEGLQNSAASTLASTGLSGLSGLESGWQTGNAQELQSLLLEPSIAGLPTTDANNMVTGGTGTTGLAQNTINDQVARYYGDQAAPWETDTNYLNLIGQPTGGSLSGSTTSPYFTNTAASALGTGLGALGLYNGLNTATAGGLASLLGLGGSSAAGLGSAAGGLSGELALSMFA